MAKKLRDIELVKKELISLSEEIGICADCTHLVRCYKVYPSDRFICACGYKHIPEPIMGKMIFCNDFNKPSYILE